MGFSGHKSTESWEHEHLRPQDNDTEIGIYCQMWIFFIPAGYYYSLIYEVRKKSEENERAGTGCKMITTTYGNQHLPRSR